MPLGLLNIGTSGNHTDSFFDALAGASIATGLIATGADVVPIVGESGIRCDKARRKVAYWSGINQYISVPYISSVLTCSCLKRTNVIIYSETQNYRDNGPGKEVGILQHDYPPMTPTIPKNIALNLNGAE